MKQDAPQTPEAGGATGKVAVKLVATWIVLPSFLLVVSGDPAWWEVWGYSVILLVPMTAFAASTARRDPGFFARRSKMQEKERAQRHLQAWGAPFFLASFVVPPLDHR
ncbi:MAG: hypothetical protein JXB32_11015, partial [Deltaproteobacteria bacterium]|nr:hypothetical protein [Deltaproteobacteria bacterium]